MPYNVNINIGRGWPKARKSRHETHQRSRFDYRAPNALAQHASTPDYARDLLPSAHEHMSKSRGNCLPFFHARMRSSSETALRGKWLKFLYSLHGFIYSPNCRLIRAEPPFHLSGHTWHSLLWRYDAKGKLMSTRALSFFSFFLSGGKWLHLEAEFFHSIVKPWGFRNTPQVSSNFWVFSRLIEEGQKRVHFFHDDQ